MNKEIPEHHKLQVHKTAHYYTLGDIDNAEHVIFALHGYGQLASRLIRKFNHLENSYVIAPEGLSVFYWNGVQGDAVASWMTSHNREDEIRDYIAYLHQLFSFFAQKLKGKKVHLFGFSQGCATLWRWIEAQQPSVDSICLWAGWLPEDVDYRSLQQYLAAINIRFIFGAKDEYLTKERMEVFRQRAEEENLPLQYIQYDGKHKVERAVLEDWFDTL